MSKMNLAMLLFGAGIGSAVTWFCVKKKYEQIAQEEIDSVKEVYRKRYDEDPVRETNNEDEEINREECAEYEKKIEEFGYSSNGNKEKVEDACSETKLPYIISIDEFGEDENYDTATLYYYKDGVLADADDEIIDDVNRVVGEEALKCLDEEDCIYVRNDRLEFEYEIVKDLRTYPEATQNMPYQKED